jgi:hypothetical protein
MELQVSLFDRLSATNDTNGRVALLASAELGELYKSIGRNCDVLEGVCINLHDIVTQLRSREITLNDPKNFSEAIEFIRAGYATRTPPRDDVLRRYARALNQFLLMPGKMIPDNPILTGTLPQWFQKGDEVACYHSGSWWHAVVVGDVTNRSKVISVFWVGWEEQDIGSDRCAKEYTSPQLFKNPSSCQRSDIRWYHDCTGVVKCGSLADYDVKYILQKYCPVVVISDSENSNAVQHSGAPSKPLPSVSHPSAPGTVALLPKKSPMLPRRSTGSKAPRPESLNASGRVTRSQGLINNGNVDEDADDENSESDVAPVGTGPAKSGEKPLVERAQGSDKKLKPRKKRKIIERQQAPMSASKVEDYFWSGLNSTETCIDTLELLAAGKTVHADVEKEGMAMLAGRCRALHLLYANQEFMEFLAIAQEALEAYEGKQSAYARDFMLRELKKFGFVVSPRMWSKLELLMLMVIILDPTMKYMGIRQKDRKDERDQNR